MDTHGTKEEFLHRCMDTYIRSFPKESVEDFLNPEEFSKELQETLLKGIDGRIHERVLVYLVLTQVIKGSAFHDKCIFKFHKVQTKFRTELSNCIRG